MVRSRLPAATIESVTLWWIGPWTTWIRVCSGLRTHPANSGLSRGTFKSCGQRSGTLVMTTDAPITVELYNRLGGAGSLLKQFIAGRLQFLEPVDAHVFFAMSRYLVLPSGAKAPMTSDDLNGLLGPTDFLAWPSRGRTWSDSSAKSLSWFSYLSIEDRGRHVREVFRTLSSTDSPVFQRVLRGEREEFELLHDLLGSIVLEWRNEFRREFGSSTESDSIALETAAASLRNRIRRRFLGATLVPRSPVLASIERSGGSDDEDLVMDHEIYRHENPAMASTIREATDWAVASNESLADCQNSTGPLPHGVLSDVATGLIVYNEAFQYTYYRPISEWNGATFALRDSLLGLGLRHDDRAVRTEVQRLIPALAGAGAQFPAPTFHRTIRTWSEVRRATLMSAFSLVFVAVSLAVGLLAVLWLLEPAEIEYAWLTVGVVAVGAVWLILVVAIDQDSRQSTLFRGAIAATARGLMTRSRPRTPAKLLGLWPLPFVYLFGIMWLGAVLFEWFGMSATAGFNIGALVGAGVAGVAFALSTE